MRIKILSIISFLAIWLSIVGINTGMLATAFTIIVTIVTFLIAKKLDLLPKRNVFSLRVFPYFFWLLKEILMSTINVIKIAWRPNMRIIPVVEPIKSMQQNDEGLVLYANSITLTPGTVTLNIIQRNMFFN